MKKIAKIFKKIGRFFWYGRSRFSILNFPLLCRLPYGSWFLARGDESGLIAFFRLPFEKKELQFVQKFLKPKMIFFDIGANQGFYTLLAAKCVRAEGRVFAFEPSPREFNYLRRNVLINGFKNTKMESTALGCDKGFADMFICLDGKGSYSSLRSPSKNVKARRKIMKVSVTTLDEYVALNNISTIDFIKIDVEGGELDVLKGGKSVLEKLRPLLLCEVSDKRTRQWGYSASEICNFAKRYKYRWFSFVSEDLLCSFGNKMIFDENLIAIPEEKLDNFKILEK